MKSTNSSCILFSFGGETVATRPRVQSGTVVALSTKSKFRNRQTDLDDFGQVVASVREQRRSVPRARDGTSSWRGSARGIHPH